MVEFQSSKSKGHWAGHSLMPSCRGRGCLTSLHQPSSNQTQLTPSAWRTAQAAVLLGGRGSLVETMKTTLMGEGGCSGLDWGLWVYPPSWRLLSQGPDPMTSVNHSRLLLEGAPLNAWAAGSSTCEGAAVMAESRMFVVRLRPRTRALEAERINCSHDGYFPTQHHQFDGKCESTCF